MAVIKWNPTYIGGEGATLAAINARLSADGLSITHEDAAMLVESRAASLTEMERVEFGRPAIVAIAEALVPSTLLAEGNVAGTLVELQATFYALRDELPCYVPDDEIIEALCGCFEEWGDAVEVARTPADEVMAFSEEYRRAESGMGGDAYRIVDDEGHAYVFDPAEWDYDEAAPGWDGERWDDGWED